VSTIGWDSTEGWDSTSGWDAGGAAVAGKHAAHMGISFNYGGPNSQTLLDLLAEIGCGYARWGIEITDFMSTPNSTSSYGTLNLSALAATIAAVHNLTTAEGKPMAVHLSVNGVPRKVNPNSGSADPATNGGQDHWFATDNAGRLIVCDYTVQVANLLDPSLGDILQLGNNECNNGSFNHDGSTNPGPGVVGVGPDVVAHQVADVCIAVRTDGPSGLLVMGPAIMNYGDIHASTGAQTILNAAAWAGAMVNADKRLRNQTQAGFSGTDARFDGWDHHNYTGKTPPLSGVSISSNTTALTSGFGWASPQLLAMRAALAFNGVTAPDGSPVKMGVSEYGTSRSGTITDSSGTFTFTDSIQNAYLAQYFMLYEAARNEGWLTFPTCWHTMIGADNDKNLFHAAAPHDPFPSGQTYIDFAHADEGVVTPPGNPPVAHFVANPAWFSYTGTTVSWQDTSANGPTSWVWDFGDGTTSNVANPTHSWAHAGSYTVTLTVTNAYGTDTISILWNVVDQVITPTPTDPYAPDVKVELGIASSMLTDTDTWAVGNNPRGKLDGPWKIAAAYHWFDVSGDLDAGGTTYQVQRGRTNPLERISVGTCSVTVRNDNPGSAGNYDSQNWLSPYFPNLRAGMARLRLSIDGQPVFTGIISDQPNVDSVGNLVTTTFSCVDFLALLNVPMKYKPEAVHTAQKRLYRIGEKAGVFPRVPSYMIAGVNTYAKGLLFDDTALSLMMDVAFAEGGMLYAATGSINFINRDHMAGAPPLFTLTDQPPNDNNRIQYAGIVRNDGVDTAYDQFSFKTPDGIETVASQHANTPRAFPEFTSPIGGTSQADTKYRNQVRVNQLLGDFGAPAFRFEKVQVEAHRYSPEQRRAFITGQEIGHVCRVERTPPGTVFYDFAGGTLARNQVIEGISIDGSPGICNMEYTMSAQLEPVG
jgi:PKD repeat protein